MRAATTCLVWGLVFGAACSPPVNGGTGGGAGGSAGGSAGGTAGGGTAGGGITATIRFTNTGSDDVGPITVSGGEVLENLSPIAAF